jgi:hypothetical protein
MVSVEMFPSAPADNVNLAQAFIARKLRNQNRIVASHGQKPCVNLPPTASADGEIRRSVNDVGQS